jgi:hypothetical protein
MAETRPMERMERMERMQMPTTLESSSFSAQWNALPRSDRSRVRRLVRMGRPVDEPGLAALAAEYARFQMQRPWMRLFWLWFVPGMFVVLGVAAGIHPIVVGIVLALGAQAVWAWFNLRKVARGSG